MPYFKKLKLFFIHIPKTGGSSVENFLYKYCDLQKTMDTFYSINTCSIKLNKHSLQHATYNEILKCSYNFNFDIKKLKILTIVRNPYDRLVSELFYNGRINLNSPKEFVENQIEIFLTDDYNYDNHKLPQYKFITHNNKLVKNIIIMKNEFLNKEMYDYGFKDFNENANKTYKGKINYQSLLNNNAKKLIYDYYKKDFDYFGYKK